jgi:hypothetical protein
MFGGESALADRVDRSSTVDPEADYRVYDECRKQSDDPQRGRGCENRISGGKVTAALA